MKKLFYLLVVAIMVFSLSACGEKENEKKSDSKKTTQTSSKEESEKEQSDETKESEEEGDKEGLSGLLSDLELGVDEEKENIPFEKRNGKFTSEEELTKEDKVYLQQVILKAWQELDYETLRYYEENAYEIDAIEQIFRKEPEAERVWKQILGAVKFYPENGYIVGKNLEYIGNKYIHDSWTAGEPFPVEEDETFPGEIAVTVFDKYFEEAPYVYHSLGPKLVYSVEDGYVKIQSTFLLTELRYESFYDIFDDNSWDDSQYKINWGNLIFGDGMYSGVLGYEYIEEDFPDYEMFVNKSFQEMFDYYIANIDKEGSEYRLLESYLKYLEDEECMQRIQEYYEKNCMLLLDMGNIVFYRPYGKYTTLPADVQLDLSVNRWNALYSYGLGEFEDMYEIFREVVSLMKDEDLLD